VKAHRARHRGPPRQQGAKAFGDVLADWLSIQNDFSCSSPAKTVSQMLDCITLLMNLFQQPTYKYQIFIQARLHQHHADDFPRPLG
jgi:hypothetical protein